MPLIDGPRIAPASGRPADALVVLLHGYGADGRDLIDIGGSWAGLLPDAAFVAPHAPEPCAEAPVGRQWFPLSLNDPRELARGTAGALPGLSRFLAEELSVLGLPWNRLSLFGFSQGAMMALSFAVASPEALGAVVGASGLYPPLTGGDPARSVSPVLLMHGSDDDLIPAEAMFASAQGLNGGGLPVEWHLSHGLGHGLDEAGLFHAGHFIARRLAAAK
ncbi:phospholipase/carboxylesterase [Azorhizobium oxalatiphilum]|uniref:Phospholipase/carboxylesterase n=1 Tax=Azorhizobium oxalatiphilum TaxID=980631 RepID=A0A917FK35_9HYPH|nr:dienelactone hydrolase family protein [Azorhizobium oxalatiphilum]GGF87406.1 phospholipase/carboxylesterase [Azorhizobium oxalatiphilum]